jgi:hypothetical protein
MKQIDNKKLCFWCLGCNKLGDENFDGVMRCKDFAPGMKNWQEKWKKELMQK